MPCGQNTFSLPILTLSDSVRVNYNYNSVNDFLQDPHHLPIIVFTLSLLNIDKRVTGGILSVIS